MNHLVYAVYDSKVEAYLQPFFMRTKGEALRSWQNVVMDRQSQFFANPGDYTLFEIGTYDELTGTLTAHAVKQNMGTALEHKKQEA